MALAALLMTGVAVAICANPGPPAPYHAAAARERVPLDPYVGLSVTRGLDRPEAVLVTPDGSIFISEAGELGAADGKIRRIDMATGDPVDYVTGLCDPRGLAATEAGLVVLDRDGLYRVAGPGMLELFVPREAFDPVPKSLSDLAVDVSGNLYVSDGGDCDGLGSVIFKITPEGQVSKFLDGDSAPLAGATGLVFESPSRLLILNSASGDLLRHDLETNESTVVNTGLAGGYGLAVDKHKRLIVSDGEAGRVWVMMSPGATAEPIAEGLFESPGDPCATRDGRHLLVPDRRLGFLLWLPLP